VEVHPIISEEITSISAIGRTLIDVISSLFENGSGSDAESVADVLIGESMPTISILKRLTLRYSLQLGRFVKNKTSPVFHFVYRR
jgi:hypothetical protein